MNIFERSARFRWFNNGKLETLFSVNIFFFFSFHSISGKVCPVRRIEYTSCFFLFFLFIRMQIGIWKGAITLSFRK